MFYWGFFVLFTCLCSIGNAEQLPQLAPAIPALPQEAGLSQKSNEMKGENLHPEVVKPSDTKLATIPPETIKVTETQPIAPSSEGIKGEEQKNLENKAKINPVLPTSSLQPAIVPVELLPHRATYIISLDKNYNDEDIADAKGQMTIQLAKVGDGWAIEQKSTLHIYYKDDSAEQVITTLATYESLDGLKYSFNAHTLRGEEEENISGDAILASKGGAGIVTYQQPDASETRLPVGTIFPTQHLIYMLQGAMRGQKVISNLVFDGSSETHEAVQVDTVLGAAQEPKLALTNKELLKAKKVWPMRMAIYTLESNAPEADYEINQHVLDRGVIRDMTLDYGTFKVKAVLTQVEVFS